MSARLRAAQEAANEIDHEDHDQAVEVALAAADAVMFDDAAVERVARLVCAANLGLDYWEHYPDDSLLKEKFRGQALAVITSLLNGEDAQ